MHSTGISDSSASLQCLDTPLERPFYLSEKMVVPKCFGLLLLLAVVALSNDTAQNVEVTVASSESSSTNQDMMNNQCRKSLGDIAIYKEMLEELNCQYNELENWLQSLEDKHERLYCGYNGFERENAGLKNDIDLMNTLLQQVLDENAQLKDSLAKEIQARRDGDARMDEKLKLGRLMGCEDGVFFMEPESVSKDEDVKTRITFKRYFTRVPAVIIALAAFDSKNLNKLQVEAWKSDVTVNGFDFNLKNLKNSEITNITYNWIACS